MATAATIEAGVEADAGRPSRTSWSAATAEAEQAEPSGNADDVPGQNVPPIG
jgi:hypothetical protein